jgi:hypothetical protein
MRISEFVVPYERTLSRCENLEELPEHTPEQRAEMWSHRFGMLLHDVLTDTESDVFATNMEMSEYRQWNRQIAGDQIELYATPARRLEARNRSNFHALNRSMLYLWNAAEDGWSSDHDRQYWLRYTEDCLAFEGFQYYLSREQRIISGGGTDILFTPAARERTQRANGVMEEFEVAISAVDWLLRDPSVSKGTTILPAPLQFGDAAGPDRKSDLIVIDTAKDTAVAIRSAEQMNGVVVDSERVVVVDGYGDLSNVLAVKTSKLHSGKESRFWPGIIAAKKLAAMVTKGNKRSPLIRELERSTDALEKARSVRLIHQQQHLARQLVGHISYDPVSIRAKIGPKIAARL